MLNTIEDFQKYVRISASVDFKSVEPFIAPAIDKYLTDYIPTELFELMNAEDPAESEEALMPFVDRAIAIFTLFLAAPQLDLSVQEGGFMVNSSDSTAPASAQRVTNYVASLEASGWNAVEMMLRFLETNKADYTTWTESDCYTLANRNLINSAVEFDKIVNIDKSRLRFSKFRTEIDKVEQLIIIPLISLEQYTELKTTEDEKHLLLKDHLKKAVVYFVAAEQIDQRHLGTANMFLSLAKKYIDDNVDDFEEYKNSGIYVGPRQVVFRTETEENKVITFGAPPRK